MQGFSLRITCNAHKDIEALDIQIAQRLRRKLDYFISSSDPLGFATRLTKPADAQYRWRIGDYRILLMINPKRN